LHSRRAAPGQAAVIIANLIADILYSRLDPRVRAG
jgi:ABC-type dipeptide/oligopeptide/nickel transport system permease component